MSQRGKGTNTRSTLRPRSRNTNPMQDYDRLPPALRCWLAQAVLPWSAQSALRFWEQSLRASRGDVAEAQRALSRIERKRLSRDVRRVWGEAHPAAAEH
ncbi:hypothetical protein EOK75_10165 [Pseudorhodobacter turbinis]|uniref:Uncharacterized protein n=1 Tax=Pseudorhodobacter turbinis TaxID=2500533 RepID=A0A4V1E0W6_9RHOB|nr:DUF6525 family protein [Pseudorhodobacter turbinis]QCO56064.1 hypothetical protein EOK75_10165 [Pseudorhodobacter turbinis]